MVVFAECPYRQVARGMVTNQIAQVVDHKWNVVAETLGLVEIDIHELENNAYIGTSY